VTDSLESLAQEGIPITCFVICKLRESSVLQGANFILADSMKGKNRKSFVFILITVWIKTFCHTVCCMLAAAYMFS